MPNNLYQLISIHIGPLDPGWQLYFDIGKPNKLAKPTVSTDHYSVRRIKSSNNQK